MVNLAGTAVLREGWARARTFVGKRDRMRSAVVFSAMALFGGARLGPGLSPLSAAFFAGCMDSRYLLPALAGCTAGMLVPPVNIGSLLAPAGCVSALAMRLIARNIRIPGADGQLLTALIAGLSVLLPGLAAAGNDPQMWLVTLILSVAAAVICLGQWLRPGRALAAPGMILTALAVVLCLEGAAIPAAFVMTGCAVAASAGQKGALVGMLLGVAGLMRGGSALATLTACAAGAAADLTVLAGGSLWQRGAAGCAAALGAYFWLNAPIEAAIAAAAVCLLPPRMDRAVAQALSTERIAAFGGIHMARERSGAALEALSTALMQLSEACGGDDPAFGEQQLISGMRAALCSGCPDYSTCWPGSDSRAVKLFCQLMTAAVETGGSPFNNGEVPPDILRQCRRGMMTPARLGSLLNEFAARRHRRIRLMEARRLIAAQFMRAAELISLRAREMTSGGYERPDIAHKARSALSALGFPVTDAAAITDGETEISVSLSENWTDDTAQKAARMLEKRLDRGYSVLRFQGREAVFREKLALSAPAAASMLSADPDMPSGDSHIVQELTGGRLMAAISDGMGSGESAAAESGRVLELLRSLIAAGIPRSTAVATVNGVMLARGGEEMFATVDLLLIDLANSVAEFTKLAAAGSYLMRCGRARRIDGGRLPLGILERVEPEVARVKLLPGDMIVMMTDGVSDVLDDGAIEEILVKNMELSPALISETLINAAAVRAPKRRDDMTALCVKIKSSA